MQGSSDVGTIQVTFANLDEALSKLHNLDMRLEAMRSAGINTAGFEGRGATVNEIAHANRALDVTMDQLGSLVKVTLKAISGARDSFLEADSTSSKLFTAMIS
jgi:hypothetical protein